MFEVDADSRAKGLAAVRRAYELVAIIAAEQPAGDDQGDGWLVCLLAEIRRMQVAIEGIEGE